MSMCPHENEKMCQEENNYIQIQFVRGFISMEWRASASRCENVSEMITKI